MRIKRLELKNFRGFEELTISFPEAPNNVAVFVGVNGAGKTSVLEAIVSLISLFYKELFEDEDEDFENLSCNKSDIKYGENFLENNIDFVFGGREVYNELKYYQDGHYRRFFDTNKQNIYLENIRRIAENYRRSSGLFSPVISFYSTDRSVLNTDLNIIDLNKLTPWEIYKDAFDITIDFKNFFKWFRSVEDVENEKRVYDNPASRDTRLESIRKILTLSFLSKFSDPRVQRQPKEDLILKKGVETLSFDSLSHGEKLMFALLGDIVRRASVSFPENPLKAEGVVLIDEIELHLHPGWQRKIVPLLAETFPNIQFIITTHSPVVLSTVKRENIFILEDFKLVEKTPHTYGRDINSILYQTFGVEERQPEVENEFRKLYALIDDPERVEEAKATLEKMKEKYGADDPELIRADMHLEFLTN